MKSSATRIADFGTITMSESSSQISPGGQGCLPCSAALQIDHRRQQPPIVAAAEDDDLLQVRPHPPTAGQAQAWSTVVGPTISKRPGTLTSPST